MTPMKRLAIAPIIMYLAIYLIVGPQEVREDSPAQWWPAAQDIFFILGIVILTGMVWAARLRAPAVVDDTDSDEQ